jgi:hypothetical protein
LALNKGPNPSSAVVALGGSTQGIRKKLFPNITVSISSLLRLSMGVSNADEEGLIVCTLAKAIADNTPAMAMARIICIKTS